MDFPAPAPAHDGGVISDVSLDGGVTQQGTTITKILPPMSRFAPGNSQGDKKQRVLDKLSAYFDRFFGLGSVT